MTNQQESRSSMYITTTAFSDNNASITASLPNYTSNLTLFKGICQEIQVIGEKQKIDNKGITENKNQLKANLIVLAADNARKLTTFARFTNNLTLQGEVNYSETDFKRFSETALRDYAQIVYDRAQSNIESLGQYDINVRSQETLQQAINAYNATLSAPRIGTNEKTQATKKLSDLFKSADKILSDMDAAVEIVRLSQPEFYRGYKTARKIIAKGITKLTLKGTITDAQNGEPLKGVTVSIVAENGMSKSATESVEMVKRTAAKGGFYIKSLNDGTYRVTLKKAGYAEATVIINVNGGERCEVKVALERA